MAIDGPRVYLHDGAGKRIGRLTELSGVRRSYTIDRRGRASFSVAFDDALSDNLRPRLGRMVVIESDEYPALWVGKITKASDNLSTRMVTATAVEYSRILDERIAQGSFDVSGTAGAGIQALLTLLASAEFPVLISAGKIDPGPSGVEAVFVDARASDIIKGLTEAAGLEWWVEPLMLTGTDLSFQLHTAKHRGANRYGSSLFVDGGPCTVTKSSEDGASAAFSLSLIGGADTATQAINDKPTVEQTAKLVESDAPFGFPVEGSGVPVTPITAAQKALLVDYLIGEGAVYAAAVAMTSRAAGVSRRVITLEVNDPSRWAELEPGDVVRVESARAFRTGFKGPVRVLAVQAMEESGSLGVSVQLLLEPTDAD